jgi:hypothetical protein
VTRITGNGPGELKSLAVRLREADPRLKNELRRNFRKEADPVVRKVQASILAMPVTRGGSPPGRVPLREAIARTVTSSVRITAKGVQVDIVSLGSRMPQGEGNMAAHVNARRGWGHPVFGRHTMPRQDWTWRRQIGKPGWFTNPVSNSARDFQDGAQAAMDETKRKLG